MLYLPPSTGPKDHGVQDYCKDERRNRDTTPPPDVGSGESGEKARRDGDSAEEGPGVRAELGKHVLLLRDRPLRLRVDEREPRVLVRHGRSLASRCA